MQVRARGLNKGFSGQGLPVADIYIASEKARSGDFDGAIEQIRQLVNDFYASGGSIWIGLATTALVEALMARGADGDLAEAGVAIDRLAGVPTDPRFVLYEITLRRLRALLARARGDEAAYREYRDRYVVMANSLGFEGHMAWAEAMT
jgi:adenylate cyclase